MSKAKRRKKTVSCSMIQWGKLTTLDGKPVCPECKQPAEMVLCFGGQPGWAHKP